MDWYPGKVLRELLSTTPPYRQPWGLGQVDGDGHPVDTCWACGNLFREDNAEYCTVCWTLKCSSGGHCLCSLTPEARRAVEAELTSLGMWESGSPRKKKRRR